MSEPVDVQAPTQGMTRHVAIQAPMVATDTIELARSSRIFRKEVLRVGSIKYKGDTLNFTSDYLDGLALAHREGVYPVVPLVFAPGDNSHTQDIERIRGEALGFERDGDRLFAVVRASNDKAAQLLRENPKIGVSVRIEQPINRADGKSWPAAIQHVLATANPVVPGMQPWEPVDLAVDDLPVIDLSTFDFATGEDATDTEETVMADTPAPFTDEETARLRALLNSIDQADQGEAQGGNSGGDGYQLPSDEELAEIAAGLFDEDLTDADRAAAERETAGASLASDNAALELAQSRLDAQEIELARIREERDTERFIRLRDDLALNGGIPPRITELAKPLLLGQHSIELSNGSNVDASKVMRDVLQAVSEHVKLIDLSAGETVFDTTDAAKRKADAQAREDEMAAYRREFGL